MLGTVWLDILFVPLFLMGIEALAPVAGTHGAYGGSIIHADYTHSAALSAVFGGAFGLRWGVRNGIVLGLISFRIGCWTLSCTTRTCRCFPVTSDISRDSDWVSGNSRKPSSAS
jgi:hypothetical protein